MKPAETANATTIGFVEDDDVIRANYVEVLEEFGFRVEAFASRPEALAAFEARLPDVALLDVALGRERDAGFQLCLDLRRMSTTLPIIFLTSHDTDVDKISGLRLGADDYLSKDTSFDYLAVRIETLLRRYTSMAAPEEAPRESESGVEGLRIDEQRSTLSWKGQAVDLPLTEIWIVEALVHSPGTVRSHRDLMKAARIVVEPNTIAAHVKNIRQRFRAVDPGFDAIRTERGLGYRWVGS